VLDTKGLTSNRARKFRPKFSTGKGLRKKCNGHGLEVTI